MKDFLISVAILAILVAAFSTIETHVERFIPADGWAFYGGSGEPVPGEGEPGEANTFSIGNDDPTPGTEQAEQAAETSSPITVEVLQPKVEKRENLTMLNYFLYGVASVLIVEIAALGVATIILAIKTYKINKRR